MLSGQMFFKYSNRGFSLASVMVGVAIVGIVAVGTLSLFENMTKSQNMADFRTQRDVLVEEIRSHLSDTQACRATLGSISLLTDGHSEAITQIRNADSSVKWMTATPYSSNTYRISSLVFNYTPGTSPTNPSTATANLMVQLQALKKVAGINVSDPKYINISIKRNPTTGAMLECIASAKMSDGIWQRSTSVNDIFYSSGSVGIGTTNPTARLHLVQGDVVAEKENDWSFFGSYAYSNNLAHSSAWVGMRGRGSRASPLYPLAGDALTSLSGRDVIDGFHVTNYGGSFIKMSATQNYSSTAKGSDITFNTTPNGSVMPVQRMLIDQTGNVGVGTADPIAKLDVDGEVRIKSGGSVCSVLNEGSIRYSAATKTFEGCDGVMWKPLGGALGNTCHWVTSNTDCTTSAVPHQASCPAGEYVNQVRTTQICFIADNTYTTISDLYCCK
ncbi:MAG: hypothetical protein K2Q26_14120 [Bdellovibrionales bacterium]|nr:hypothetical protein [Bdellovibrionales bacterium]